MGVSVPQIFAQLPYSFSYMSSNILGPIGWYGKITKLPTRASSGTIVAPVSFKYDLCTADGTPLSALVQYKDSTTQEYYYESSLTALCTSAEFYTAGLDLDSIVALFSQDGLDDYVANPTSTSNSIVGRFAIDCILDDYYLQGGLLYTYFTVSTGELFAGASFYFLQAAPYFTGTLQTGSHYLVYLSKLNLADLIDWSAAYASSTGCTIKVFYGPSKTSTSSSASVSIGAITDTSYRYYIFIPMSIYVPLCDSLGVTTLSNQYLKVKPLSYTSPARITPFLL